MKKIILSLALFLMFTSASFAQSSWSLNLGSGVFYVIPGVTYGISACYGTEGTQTIQPVPGNPFSFVICDGYSLTAFYRNCPNGLAFNPNSLMCDWVENVAPYYPDFPWEDYQ